MNGSEVLEGNVFVFGKDTQRAQLRELIEPYLRVMQPTRGIIRVRALINLETNPA